MFRSLGYGRKGDKGDKGDPGAKGDKGDAGTAATVAVGTVTTGAAGSSASVTNGGTSSAAVLNFTIPRGATGSPSLTFLGNVTVSETTIISLALGMKRMTVALAGALASDTGKLVAVPNGLPTTGVAMVNVHAATNGNITVEYFMPLLGIGASYSIPLSVYRIT